jgi:methylglutaconyl-CoA hydratase
MTLQTLSLDTSPRGVATLLLNRPERGNAFNQAMLDEFRGTLAALAADEGVRIVVLRGSGKHFCTGADLAGREAETAGATAPSGPAASPFDVLVALDTFPKPTIAVVQGGAIGGGAAFAACCDIVIASNDAFFSIPEVRVGMAPLGVTPFLIRALGHRAFRRYGLSGERIGAAEALRLGMAHELCAAAELDGTLARIADAVLHGAPGALRELKAAAAQYAWPPQSTILANKPPGHRQKTAEMQEGIASFREKRKPRWYPE